MIRTLLVAVAAAAIAAAATVPAASATSCYFPNCTAPHQAGEGNIPSTSPHYCSSQDRDQDGVACEW